MPRIKRWFPVSHDLNADPEVWAMRHTIGEKSLSIWLELLSIADRNDSELPGDYEELVRAVSGRCQSTVSKVIAVCDFAKRHLWLASDPPLRVLNYAKYHRTREPNSPPPGNYQGSPLNQTRPDLSDMIREDSPLPPSSLILPAGNRRPRRESSIPIHGDWPSVEALVNLYNQQSPDESPAVQLPVSEARVGKARKYLRQFSAQGWWEETMKQIHRSKFLRGLLTSNNGQGHAMRADYDWLLSKGKDGTENVVKVHDGKYHD